MDVWIQESLFDTAPASNRRAGGAPRVERLGTRHAPIWVSHTRVTRDPEIALSHAESTRVASDFRVGLAQAFGRLSQDEQDRLRNVLQTKAS